MINGVHHVNLATADMDRFLRFYRDQLGLEQRGDNWLEPGNEAFETIVGLAGTRVRIAQLAAGNLQLEVFAYEHPQPAEGVPMRSCDVGIRHLAFDVTDIDAEYERLVGLGVSFFSPPQSIDGAGVRSVYLRDPDGNIVELQEVFPGSVVDRDHITRMRGEDAAPAEPGARPVDRNRELVGDFFAGVSNGELPGRLFAPDFTAWTTGGGMSGASYLSSVPLLKKVFADGPHFTFDSFTGEEDRVLVEARNEGRLIDGEPFHQRYVFVFRIRDGRIVSIAEHFDADVARRQLVPLIQALRSQPHPSTPDTTAQRRQDDRAE
jgi:catechol 2,3-dioxygenase-like lactoylglutathione lyase family enzyme/ketosteroid isomerase-like protein